MKFKCCDGELNKDCHWDINLNEDDIHEAKQKRLKYKEIQSKAKYYEKKKNW